MREMMQLLKHLLQGGAGSNACHKQEQEARMRYCKVCCCTAGEGVEVTLGARCTAAVVIVAVAFLSNRRK